MNDESIRKSLEAVARRSVPENTNLWPRLAARIERKDTVVMQPKWKLAWVILLALLGLSVITGAAYAIGRMTGYLPGVGFVQTSALRVLAEPVSQTRDGITVTIEQVIVDSERTVIIYKTEGLTVAAANSQGEGAVLGSADLLRLPDGTLMSETPGVGYAGTPEPLVGELQTEGGWPNYVLRLVYPPVPQEVDSLMLLIPVLQNMPSGAAPENWVLAFRLKPAPADLTLVPVVAVATADASPAAGETALPVSSNSSSLNGFTLRLDSVIEVDDGFVFTGSVAWEASIIPAGEQLSVDSINMTLSDSNGEVIPIEAVQLVNGLYLDEHTLAWSYRTNRKTFSGPLTLTASSVSATLYPQEIAFELDLGAAPQIGQIWEIGRDFNIEGHTLHLSTVQMTADTNPCWTTDLVFNFTADEAGLYAWVSDAAPQSPLQQTCSGGGGGGGSSPADPNSFSTGVSYSSLPAGVHQFTIGTSVPYTIPGPWQVVWNPPSTAAATPTVEAQACLTLEQWNQGKGQTDPLPAGLGGKIVTTVNEGGLLPALYVSSLDGTDSRKIATGAWPSLSSDGTRLAYSAENGLQIVDLSTGESTLLGTDGYHFIWSPDSTRILFTNTFHLYVVNADGSGLETIDIGSSDIVAPAGWLPDGQTIVYGVLGGNGFNLATYNLQTGERNQLFSFQNKAGFAAISPDGQWVVFSDKVFGADNWGIFVSRLDGSERRPVVDPSVPTAFFSVWSAASPSGSGKQWLIVNAQDADGTQIATLVDPFTCQAVHLQGITGMVEGWSP